MDGRGTRGDYIAYELSPTQSEVSPQNSVSLSFFAFVVLLLVAFVVGAAATQLNVYFFIFYTFILIVIVILFIVAYISHGEWASSSAFFQPSNLTTKVFIPIAAGVGVGLVFVLLLATRLSLVPTNIFNGQTVTIEGLSVATFMFVTLFVAPIVEDGGRDVITWTFFKWMQPGAGNKRPMLGISAVLGFFGFALLLLLWNSGLWFELIGVAVIAIAILSYTTGLKGKIINSPYLALALSAMFGAAIFAAIHAGTFALQPNYYLLMGLTFGFGIAMFFLNLATRSIYAAVVAHGVYNGGILVLAYSIDPFAVAGLLGIEIFILYAIINPAGVFQGIGKAISGRKARTKK